MYVCLCIVSVQINKMFVCCCMLSVQPLLSLLVGYSSEWECTKLGFILRERGLGPLRNRAACGLTDVWPCVCSACA